LLGKGFREDFAAMTEPEEVPFQKKVKVSTNGARKGLERNWLKFCVLRRLKIAAEMRARYEIRSVPVITIRRVGRVEGGDRRWERRRLDRVSPLSELHKLLFEPNIPVHVVF
jgi:hypothetical protein